MGAITGWSTAIWASFATALGQAFSFIPKLLGFLLILLLGWLIASALEKSIVWLLKRLGFEHFSHRIGLARLGQRISMNMDAVGILGKIVYWFVFLIFLVPAVDALGLTTISNLLNQIVIYLPNVFIAILVLFLGTVLANFVSDVLRKAMGDPTNPTTIVYTRIARYSIIGFALLMALYQLQIAPAIIQTLFTAIIGAVALAFGLAFGLGGRDAAQRWLARGEESVVDVAAQISAENGLKRARIAEQQRMEQERIAEQQREQQRLEQARIAEQQRMEQARLAEQQRMEQAQIAAEQARLAAEQRRLEQARLAMEQRRFSSPQNMDPTLPTLADEQFQRRFSSPQNMDSPSPPTLADEQFRRHGYAHQSYPDQQYTQQPYPDQSYNQDQQLYADQTYTYNQSQQAFPDQTYQQSSNGTTPYNP